MGDSPKDTNHGRSACTECQRRKQKCNREWPCNHCQKRKVADKCRFGNTHPSPDKAPSHDVSRKRQMSHDDNHSDSSFTNPWEDDDVGLEALGYTASHLYASLGGGSSRKSKAAPKANKQYYMNAATCTQLDRALRLLPPRPYTDILVQNFLNHVNYHYYIIYPPSFLEDYRNWWTLRSEHRPLSLQWTCLLLTVCACSTQYTDVDLERKLETDLGETTQKLSEQYHNAARELHSVIPVGNNHLLNVQSLLHSCYWYKSEARFVECWHVLSAAIREAQELGIHKESVSGHMVEFDREMQRRVWCILDTWDWQMSALLSRPMLIDRTDSDAGLPSLTLEGYSPPPLLHMKLQSELIGKLSRRFGVPKNVVQPHDVQLYQSILEKWMASFPAAYSLNNPDKSNDNARPWIVLHRHYLHAMAYSMILDPIRPYLANKITQQSSIEMQKIRSDGIDYALRLLSVLHPFFEHVYPRDAKFHFVLFCIFDTAAVLCSALMHDPDEIIPRRNEILAAIDKAVSMLKRLNTVTKTARTSYEVLVKVAQRIPRAKTATNRGANEPSRRRQHKPRELALTPPSMSQAEMAVASDPGSVESYISYTTPPNDPHGSYPMVAHGSSSPYMGNKGGMVMYGPPGSMAPQMTHAAMVHQTPGMHMPVSGVDYPASYVDMTPPTDEFYNAINFGTISERELGDLATLWNYESLNLGFINPNGG